MSCAKTAEPIKISFGLWTWVGPKETYIKCGPDPPCKGAIFRENDMPEHA